MDYYFNSQILLTSFVMFFPIVSIFFKIISIRIPTLGTIYLLSENNFTSEQPLDNAPETALIIATTISLFMSHSLLFYKQLNIFALNHIFCSNQFLICFTSHLFQLLSYSIYNIQCISYYNTILFTFFTKSIFILKI